MLPLSVAIVCRNNEETLGRTLDSVCGLASEIVALDSGSTDGTLDLLEGAGAVVHRVEWAGHIATKQRALDLCAQPWVLSIDSDESVEPDLAESIRRFVGDPGDAAGARVNRKVWYAGRFLEHAWQPERRLRLVRLADVRAGVAAWGGVDPHDALRVRTGRIADLPGTLRHDSIRTMASFLRQQIALSEVSAAALRGAGARASRTRLVVSPAMALGKQIVLRGAWRDGWRGWAAAGATALATLAKHTLLLDAEGSERERE